MNKVKPNALTWASYMSAILPIYYQNGAVKQRKPDNNAKSGKTRKGATHKVNPVFLSRQSRWFKGITPAQYRHRHLGAKKKVVG